MTLYIDHFVWAVPDLEAGMDQFEEKSSIRPSLGGVHPGKGTKNALVAIGKRTYLEILAPDPLQSGQTSWMNVNQISKPCVIRWVLGTDQLPDAINFLKQRGLETGPIIQGRRTNRNGEELSWQLTDPDIQSNPARPFLIDWGSGPHPCDSMALSCHLNGFILSDTVVDCYSFLKLSGDIPVRLQQDDCPKIQLELLTPRGKITL